MPHRRLPPFRVSHARNGRVPVVLSSPHSGRCYPDSMLARLGVARAELRILDDGPVDSLVEEACADGATLIAAEYARAYVDLNRDPAELDPELVGATGQPPGWRLSSKVRAGLGVIPSRVGSDAIYREPLLPGEVRLRLSEAYFPYHQELARLLALVQDHFGTAVLLDCHSMPAVNDRANGAEPIDIALGDRFGRTCRADLVDLAHRLLAARGFRVARNRPYAGGFITENYGCPARGMHALQIEIRRGLFMDERTHQPHAGIGWVQACIRELVCELGRALAPAPAAIGWDVALDLAPA
jgi:N-formylglutamate amidohydrolase